MINLRQKDPVIEHILQFQKLSVRVEGILDDKLLDLFIGTLKGNIQHELRLFEQTSLEKDFIVARKVESKNLVMATKRTTPKTSKESNAHLVNTHQPIILTPQQLEERREKRPCFNCDRKYSNGHNCGEKKLFFIDYEGEEAEDEQPSQTKGIEETTSEEITHTISYHAVAGICTPQTLKIEGYIKKIKVTMLIDCGRTHYFIHCKLAKALHCSIYPALEFQVMILNGGTINFLGKCHKITLTIGEYVLSCPILSIPMAGVYVVLRVQWLQSLGTTTFNFLEIFMKFSLDGK